MSTDSASLSLLSVISLLSFFIALLTSKYSEKINNGVLLDSDFEKPQAFHKDLIPRSGGIANIISFIVFIFFHQLLFDKLLLNYLTLALFLFFLVFF